MILYAILILLSKLPSAYDTIDNCIAGTGGGVYESRSFRNGCFPSDDGTSSNSFAVENNTVTYKTFNSNPSCSGNPSTTSTLTNEQLCRSQKNNLDFSVGYLRIDPQTIASSSSSSSKVCFAGSETVAMEFGEVVPISSVRVGDRILAANAAGELSFSDVIAVPHAENSIDANFIQIGTTDGKSLKLTPEHLIPAGSCDSNFDIIPAGEVVIGSCLRTIDGFEVVNSIELVKSSGIYTVVTMEEFIAERPVSASTTPLFARPFANLKPSPFAPPVMTTT